MPETPYVCICKKCGMQFLSSSNHRPYCKGCLSAKRNSKLYTRVFWKNRKIVLKRDEQTCQCCGCKQDTKQTNKLCVHHIDGDRQNNSPSNLITLCTQCHLSLHNKYSKYVLRRSNIYKLFSTDIRFGEFGKNLIYGASKQLVKKQFKGKPKLFFKTKK